jgi:hypothetical protein
MNDIEREIIIEKYGYPKNHRKKWDEDDEYILEKLIKQGTNLDSICDALERTPNAIFSHIAHKIYPLYEI